MTRSRFVGQSAKLLALRKRQQAFLQVLVDCNGSRLQAVAVSGTPLGTVARWQSDPWFSERYTDIRESLVRDARALRESLVAKVLAMALGEREGLLKPAAARRIVDKLDEAARLKTDEQPSEVLSVEECDAEIRRLLRG